MSTIILIDNNEKRKDVLYIELCYLSRHPSVVL
jgi:hypothetical protein